MSSRIFQLLVVVGGMFLANALYFASHGIDFTDEGCYLNSILNPWLYNFSVSHYNFLYHPLFSFLGGSIVKLRIVNMLALFFLSMLTFYCLLKYIVKNNAAFIAFSFSCASLVSFKSWFDLTPNYNGLALQGLIVVILALFIFRDDDKKNVMSGIALGIGSALTFIGKPSTASMLPVFTLLFMWMFRCFSLKMLLISVFSSAAMLSLFSFYVGDNINSLIPRIIESVNQEELLVSYHSLHDIFRIDSLPYNDFWGLLYFFAFLLSFYAAFHLTDETRFARKIFNVLAILSLVLSIMLLLDILSTKKIIIYPYLPLIMLFFLLGAAAAFGLHMIMGKKYKNLFSIFAILGLYIFLNYIYAFGTNFNYWIQGCNAAFFWIISIVEMIRWHYNDTAKDKIQAYLITLSSFVMLTSVLTVCNGMDNPYRQPYSIKNYTGSTSSPHSPEKIYVAKETEVYLHQLRSLMLQNGFTIGTSMVDLTGRYPASLYFVGAKAIGAPWILGNYLGSLEAATALLLAVEKEELRKAWVLTEPDGPRAIPALALEPCGLLLKTDYILVGSVMNNEEKFLQYVYKPKLASSEGELQPDLTR
jgi:hypothetical protein